MSILLTGGAGFIGQYVATALVSRGYDVLALDSLRDQVHEDPDAAVRRFPGDVLRLDVSEESSWRNLPEIEGVVNLAAETGTAQSMYQQEKYRRTNVQGTERASEYCAAHQIPLVLLSSRAVYGEGHRSVLPLPSSDGFDLGDDGTLLPSREDDPHRPLSFYGKTKSLAEAAALARLGVTGRIAILRPQNVIGVGQALHNPYTGVLAAFLARLKAGMGLSVYGDGTQTRDFIHVSDTASAIVWALETVAGGQPLVLNLGTGKRLTLDQLAQSAIDAAPGASMGIEHVDLHRPGDIDHACADMRKAWSLGMPRPRFTARAAIADFIVNSWDHEGADPKLWDDALDELARFTSRKN